jgi:hypothetical protein
MITRFARYLLGAFICVQLVYLPLANFLQRIPRRPDPLPEEIRGRYQREGQAVNSDSIQSVIDTVGMGCDRWAEGTGQAQGWSLFAPRFGEAGTFLTLIVTANDGTQRELRSPFEPADPSHYVRFDVLNYRLFYREMSYAMVYAMWTPDSFAKEADAWRDAIRQHVTAFRRSLSTYVKWRIATEQPDTEVQEMTINIRVHLPPKPGEESSRPAPLAVPLAKWSPDEPMALRPFDPVTSEFVRMGQ